MTNDITTHSFLDQLRAKTHESHQKLERIPVSVSITNPNISIKQYAHYLQLMQAVIAQTESLVFPKVFDHIADIESRRKLHLIEDDLLALDAPIKQFSAVFKNADQFTTPFSLGILYTVEGSTLGGRFILKNIQSALGFDEQHGARFFFGYGNQTGMLWKNFLHQLDAAVLQTNDPSEIIAGAQYAFDAIHEHFSANPL